MILKILKIQDITDELEDIMKEISDEIKNKACIEFCGKIQAEECLIRNLQSCDVATNYYLRVLKYRDVIK